MKKRIVICRDGTWKRLDSECPTNTVRLAKAVLPLDQEDGTVQIAFYLDGTGTLARLSERLFGGLLGSGLAETVAEAYRFLVFTYRPGDEISAFGFSRGAYTARPECPGGAGPRIAVADGPAAFAVSPSAARPL